MPNWLPSIEAAAACGLTITILYKALKRGAIVAEKRQGKYYFDMRTVAALVSFRNESKEVRCDAPRIECAFCHEHGRVSMPEETARREYICWNCGSVTGMDTLELNLRGPGVGHYLMYRAGFTNEKRQSNFGRMKRKAEY